MFARSGLRIGATLDAVACRYRGGNPPLPLVFRAYSCEGIVRGKDHRYEADFNRYFPGAPDGAHVYA
ncbi:MAG: hypothetical protein ACREFX_05200, partial [Opitutaceae bacterium]